MLKDHKEIFIEKEKNEWKSKDEKSKMKKAFGECSSSKNRRGALFFIVMEGNFSRGSNYENLSTLSTVIFGVPFLNR